MRAALLAELYRTLGLDPSDAGGSESETVAAYSRSASLSAEAQRAFAGPILATLRPGLEPALTLTVGVSAAPLLRLAPGAWPADLDRAADVVRSAPPGQSLSIRIDKRALVPLLPTPAAGCSLLYYLFGGRFARFLDGSLESLDADLFPRDGERTIVVVSDADVQYVGPLLSIVGEGRYVAAGAPPCPPIGPDTAASIERYRQATADQLNWSGLTLERITPLHLRCEPRGSGHDAIDRALARKLWYLGLLFTANRSVLRDDHLLAHYSGPERTAAVGVAPTGDPPADRTRLAWLGSWPFEGDRVGTDRLAILQNVFARELDSQVPADNAAKLATGLEYLQDEAEWHHRVYVDKQIDKQFEQLRAATEYTTEVAKKIGDSVDGLAKGLTDAALAGVAAVFAAFATPLLKNDFPVPVIFVLLLIYAGYVLIVQVWYRLGSIRESADILRREVSTRFATYGRALGEQRIVPLSTQVDERWRYFERWFSRTRLCTCLLAVGMVLLAFVWPYVLTTFDLTGSLSPPRGAQTGATATPTPTVAPATAVPGAP